MLVCNKNLDFIGYINLSFYLLLLRYVLLDLGDVFRVEYKLVRVII